MSAWRRLGGSLAGRWLFSRAVCWKAPYFASISPLFVRLDATGAEVTMRKRRRVTNHLGTVHAIAQANLCEIAAGTLMEAALVPSMRWIPKGMTIQYLARAPGRIRGVATMPAYTEGVPADLVVPVEVTDANGVTVAHADITMYVTPRPVNRPK